jgi:hypothetical protein
MLRDVFRLAALHEDGKELQQRTMFVYLTARWRKNYLRNPENRLAELFDLPTGKSLFVDQTYLKQRPHIPKHRLGNIIPCTIESMYSCCLPDMHALRVYRVGRFDAGAES